MAEGLEILVTGGAGYIGAVLVPELLARGHRVTVLDDFRYSQDSLAACCACECFEVVRGDARDERKLREALRGKDVVIPLAALVGAPLCARDPIGATTTNLDAIKLLCSLRSIDQWVLYPNTNSGYGVGEGGEPCTEESPLRPISLYGRTKVEAEAVVMEGVNTLAFRFATVFGMSPRMRIDLLVNDFVYRALYDSALVVFQGHFKRNYVHVRDAARAFVHALDNFERMKGQVFNVGLDSANLSKLELCERIRHYLPRFTYLEAPIGEDPDQRDYVVLNEKIRATGFEPAYSLDDGIRELIKGFAMVRDADYRNA